MADKSFGGADSRAAHPGEAYDVLLASISRALADRTVLPVSYAMLDEYMLDELDEAGRRAVEAAVAAWPGWAEALAEIRRAVKIESGAGGVPPQDALSGAPEKWRTVLFPPPGPDPNPVRPATAEEGPPAPRPAGIRRFLATAVVLLVCIGGSIWLGGRVLTPKDPGPQTRLPEPAIRDARGAITLSADGALLGLDDAPADVRLRAARALRDQRFAPPLALEGLVGPRGAPRGGPPDGLPFALTHPVGTAVEADRPAFGWEPLPDGADHYEVTVVTPDDELIRSGPVRGTTWQPPAGQALARGGIYEWQVTAVKGGQRVLSPKKPLAPEARFRILDQDEVDRLSAARARSGPSHLSLAALYVEAGLLDAAESELEKLLDLNRDSPAARQAVERFLNGVRDVRRPKAP